MKGKITVIGAGLAGSLLSLFLARRGFSVDLYERRPDLRATELTGGRSINLAISTRGLHALSLVGMEREILDMAIPMRGRMVHPLKGQTSLVPYGKDDNEVINSISRGGLNRALLRKASESSSIRLFFDQRCLGMDFKSGTVRFRDERDGSTSAVESETVIATDGVASPIRMEMLAVDRFDFSQSYLEHGYKELTIPAADGGGFRLEKHALHIWPRGGYMMIALPNLDGSFTCTLFFPHEGPESFAALKSEQDLRAFFERQFPDALPLMPGLANEYFGHATGSLITIKCAPWHVGGRALLLGDSAHAIVPFYGQGMNCAFEDCVILDGCIERHSGRWEAVFADYFGRRKLDTDAIADLALDNFIEMRDTSGDPKFALKKSLEHLLETRYPGEFISKYSMVTFHRIPYSVAMKKGRVQDRVLMEICRGASGLDQIDPAAVYARVKSELEAGGI